MVMKVEPVVRMRGSVRAMAGEAGHLVMLTRKSPAGSAGRGTPGGLRTHFAVVRAVRGFDERIRIILEPEEISIGDYILNGGEVAAMTIVDAVIRLVPGVLGDEDRHADDSFSGPMRWLELGPIYNVPAESEARAQAYRAIRNGAPKSS